MFAIYDRSKDRYHIRGPDGWSDNLNEEEAKWLLAERFDLCLGHAEWMLRDARELEKRSWGWAVEYDPTRKQRRWSTKGLPDWDGSKMRAQDVYGFLRYEAKLSPKIAKHIMRVAKLCAEIQERHKKCLN
jgi:hypothetical protein